MPLIYLSQGLVAIVDDEDLARVERYRWCAHWHGYKGKGHYEAIANVGGGKQLKMHRLIMEAPASLVVDHINGDQLDNRRENLRVVSARVNNGNRHHERSSQFPGVFREKGHVRWRAAIAFRRGSERRTISLGTFDSEEAAAAAYQTALQGVG